MVDDKWRRANRLTVRGTGGDERPGQAVLRAARPGRPPGPGPAVPGARLLGHPGGGASCEGFAIEQVLAAVRPSEAYYWGTHGGAELDLFFVVHGRRCGVEVKFSGAPAVTHSLRTALDDLALDHLWIVYPGRHRHPVDERITAGPIADIGGLPAAVRIGISSPAT